MVELVQNPMPPEPPRFSLRLPHWSWFLLATAVLVVGCVGLSIWLPFQQEQQLIARVEGSGGHVITSPIGPGWLQSLLGNDRMTEVKVFNRASLVQFEGPRIDD